VCANLVTAASTYVRREKTLPRRTVEGHGDAERERHQKLFHLSSSRPQRQLIFSRHLSFPKIRSARAALKEGDPLIVTKLDRLARSTRDLLNTLAEIAKASATFRSLGDPWCDTTSAHGRLMLTVLGGLAEFERHLILARTSEGRQRAQQRGVRFGRKPSLTEHQRQEALARRATGEALVDIARSYPQSSALLQNAGIAPRPQSAALRGVAGEVPVYEIP
jgi:hypothetical protein